MAKLLLVSKFRKFQGGVERHLYDLIDGMSGRGHIVELFSSEDVADTGGAVFDASARGAARINSARSMLWNSRARTLMRKKVEQFQPDVIHYHSIYHQLSPSILGAVDVPTLMTLHDYKLSAPCYTLYRDGEVCEECVGKSFASPAIRYKCISGSTAASALCAAEAKAHHRRYKSEIGRFIVPSKYARDVVVRGGLPSDRVSVIPWGVATRPENAVVRNSRIALFAGRLHPTKGLEVLLEAWQALPTGHDCVLRIAGNGELEPLVRHVASADPSIEFLGMLSSEALRTEVSGSGIVVVPSLFPETMGLSALEALMAGTPVVSSGRGALGDLRGPGVWTLSGMEPQILREALVELLIAGLASDYERDLAARDLSIYRFDRMIDEIQVEYSRTVEEHKR